MRFAEHRITTNDGPQVYARDYAAEGASRGVPVLCLHGLTRNSADFETIVPTLTALGRRVVAVDVRGRGKSDNDPDPARYRPDVYIADTLRLLDTLGIDRAVLFGTSMGGIMTMLAAVMAPGRIAAAILNDIGPVVDPKGIARIGSYVGKQGPFASWDEMLATVKAGQGPLFPRRGDAFWQAFVRRVGRELPDGRVAFAYDPAIAQAFARAPDAPPPPSMIPLFEALAKVPVLVIRGAMSDILAPEGVAAMRAIKPDLDVVEVPNTGHAPTLDEPEVRRAVEGFLSRVA
jgi:pimeloyl-ACP methyl ester carboxylesterase